MTAIKPSQRLRERAKLLDSKAAQSSGHSRVDIILQRLSHVTQVGVFALGVFGYFYTVLPVFQNQQLQEQAAKLELEKSATQSQLDELRKEEARVKVEIASLRNDRDKERARNASLLNETIAARQEQLHAKRRRDEAELALASNLQELDASRWEVVMSRFAGDLGFVLLHSSSRVYGQQRSSMSSTILDSGKEWPKPYEHLLEALKFTQTGKGSVDIPSSYYAEMRSFIDSRQSDLQCLIPDFQALHASYKLQLTAIESSVDDETEASLAKLRGEYAAKGEQIKITEGFRRSTRVSVLIAKTHDLDASFQKKLHALREQCSQKTWEILADFRKSKVPQ